MPTPAHFYPRSAPRFSARLPLLCGLLVLAVGLLGGCRDIKTPHTRIPREQMKAILIDLYIAEQGAIAQATETPQRDSLARIYYHAVLQHHGISPEAFQPVYEEYQRFPEFMSNLNKEIAEEISRELENPRYRNTQGAPPPHSQGPDVIRRPGGPLAPR